MNKISSIQTYVNQATSPSGSQERDPGSSFFGLYPMLYYTSGSNPNPGAAHFPALAQKWLTWHVFFI